MLALGIAAAGSPCSAQSIDLSLAYAGNALTNITGGASRGSSYSHNLVVEADVKPGADSPWQLEGAVAWTAGSSLSARAVHDISAVQGTFNGGNALWLYKAALTHQQEGSTLSLGRISAGDWFGAPAGFSAFVNAAFSSNGGAISINDPGRPTSPASSWGVVGERTLGRVTLRAGSFLSNPARTAIDRHGTDLAFRPSEGVITLGEIAFAASERLTLGAGGYCDTARFDRYDGIRRRGNGGGYGWAEYRPAGGPLLTAMVQVAPAEDRNVFPVFFLASASWTGLIPGRGEDVASIGIQGGRISPKAGLGSHEAAIEANYQFKLAKSITLQPDLQVVIRPSGTLPTAMVVGAQLQLSL